MCRVAAVEWWAWWLLAVWWLVSAGSVCIAWRQLLCVLSAAMRGLEVYGFVYKVAWASFHFGINLSDIHAGDAYAGGHYAANEPQRHEYRRPALYGAACEVLVQCVDYDNQRHERHGESCEGDELQWRGGERCDAVDGEAYHLLQRIFRLASGAGRAVVLDISLVETQLPHYAT